MMNLLLVLSILFLTFWKVPANYDNGFSRREILEILELKRITDSLPKSNHEYKIPLKLTAVNEDDVSFYLYSRENTSGTKIEYKEANQVTSKGFDTNLDTIYLIHGWHNTYVCSMDVILRTKYLEVRNLNVFAVDWDKVASKLYIEAYGDVPAVGKYIAEFIQTISETYNYSLDKVTVVGHSLGAQIAGHTGQNTNGNLGAIIGLDPAGPLYFENDTNNRLSEDDAKYVCGIHTNAQFLGVNYRVGDADFWPNGGYTQPGCTDLGSCSHGRAVDYLAESIENSEFISRECDTYDNYKNGNCNSNPKAPMGGPNYDSSIVGNFYLTTNSESPFAQGNITR